MSEGFGLPDQAISPERKTLTNSWRSLADQLKTNADKLEPTETIEDFCDVFYNTINELEQVLHQARALYPKARPQK